MTELSFAVIPDDQWFYIIHEKAKYFRRVLFCFLWEEVWVSPCFRWVMGSDGKTDTFGFQVWWNTLRYQYTFIGICTFCVEEIQISNFFYQWVV